MLMPIHVVLWSWPQRRRLGGRAAGRIGHLVQVSVARSMCHVPPASSVPSATLIQICRPLAETRIDHGQMAGSQFCCPAPEALNVSIFAGLGIEPDDLHLGHVAEVDPPFPIESDLQAALSVAGRCAQAEPHTPATLPVRGSSLPMNCEVKSEYQTLPCASTACHAGRHPPAAGRTSCRSLASPCPWAAAASSTGMKACPPRSG